MGELMLDYFKRGATVNYDYGKKARRIVKIIKIEGDTCELINYLDNNPEVSYGFKYPINKITSLLSGHPIVQQDLKRYRNLWLLSRKL